MRFAGVAALLLPVNWPNIRNSAIAWRFYNLVCRVENRMGSGSNLDAKQDTRLFSEVRHLHNALFRGSKKGDGHAVVPWILMDFCSVSFFHKRLINQTDVSSVSEEP
jgi:hypothetical protein